MKKLICTLTILLATTTLVLANVPQILGGIAKTPVKKAIVNVAAQQKAVAAKTVIVNQGDTIYADDFESKTTDWTVDSLETKSISQLGLANDIAGCSGCFDAFSGTQMLVSGYSTKTDVKTYMKSPGITLPAGEVWVSAYFMTGGTSYPCSGKLLYGTSADVAQQTAIIEFTEEKAGQEWTLLKYKITVNAEGTYYFTVVSEADVMSSEGGGWFVAVDNFCITKSEVFPPKPQINDVVMNIYGAEGVYSATSPTTIYLAADSANIVMYGDYSYVDTAYFTLLNNTILDDLGGKYPDAIAARTNTTDNPFELDFKFYAKSEMGDTTANYSYTIYHNYTSQDVKDVVTNMSPANDLDYYFSLFGDQYLNSYYQKKLFTGYGERFSVTAVDDETPHYAQLNGIELPVYNYWVEEEDQSKYITISVYTEKIINEETGEVLIGDCIGRVRKTFAEAFGKNTFIEKTPTLIDITFDKPINVTGTFYVFIEADSWEVAEGEYCDLLFHTIYAGVENVYPLWKPYNTMYVVYDGEKLSFDEAISSMVYAVEKETYHFWATGIMNASVTFYGEEPEVVGVKRVTADSQLAIYPNPAKEVLYINNLASNATATITDVTGKQLMSLSLVENSVSIANLSKGIYFISIKDADGLHTAKFVKE